MENKPGSKCSRICSSGCEYCRRAIKEYFLEFSNTDSLATELRTQAATQIINLVNDNSVVIFVLPGLVSAECSTAQQLLADRLQPEQLTVSDAFEYDIEALGIIVGPGGPIDSSLRPLPAIFAGGRYVGSLQDLEQHLADSTLDDILAAEPELLSMPKEQLLVSNSAKESRLLHQAGGQPFWFFHFFMYGNVVRAVSFFHVLLSLACIICISQDQYSAAQGLATFMFFDLVLLLWGPTPFSVLGVISTLLVWPRRGPVITSLPYKVIFLFYAALLLGPITMQTKPFGSHDAPDKMDSQGQFITIAINSTLLTVLRF